MPKLILLRHGQSVWNRDNRFTGWVDVDLSETGVEEARKAATLMVANGLRPDWCCTSYLKRAIRTLWIALDGMDLMWLPTDKSWRLNERHYGALQGLNKAEMAERVGKEQVHIWRRSFADQPPALEEDDERFPGHDPRYAGLSDAELPRTESLKDTIARFLPYWHETIVPHLRRGETVLVSAHGNSLRGAIKHLDKVSDEDITGVEIPTGVPLLYELDDSLEVTTRRYLNETDKAG